MKNFTQKFSRNFSTIPFTKTNTKLDFLGLEVYNCCLVHVTYYLIIEILIVHFLDLFDIFSSCIVVFVYDKLQYILNNQQYKC